MKKFYKRSSVFARFFYSARRTALSLLTCFLLSFGVTVSVPVQPAYASCAFGFCPLCVLCVNLWHAAYVRPRVRAQHRRLRRHVRTQMDRHVCQPAPDGSRSQPSDCFGYTPNVELVGSDSQDDFIVDYFWKEHVLSSMMAMNEQIAKGAMAQMFSLGAFFDARQQLETQQLFQTKMAEAHRDYHSSVGLCTMGTAAAAFPKTAMTVDFIADALTTRSQDRQMNAENIGAQAAAGGDIFGRAGMFARQFCDPEDNNGGLDDFCGAGGVEEQLNKDVDFVRGFYEPLTLDIDLEDGAVGGDEPRLFAMASNLFAHESFNEVATPVFEKSYNQDEILDMRAILAKRSVAENSFYTIAGMKSSGTEWLEATGAYVPVIMQQLGMNYDEALELLGERPSYWALTEMLSKKMYQNPRFYINLYDKPANVLRKTAAIKAMNAVQGMDQFKSQLRNESMLAVLLELKLMEEQNRVKRVIDKMRVED